MHQLNTQSFVAEKQRVKLAMNRAVHAASLETDKVLLAEGELAMDKRLASEQFYRYLRIGLQLDTSLTPSKESFLRDPVKVVHLSFVQEGVFPRWVEVKVFRPYGRNVVREWVEGPSVFAVIEVVHPGWGTADDTPYLVSAVEEVRW